MRVPWSYCSRCYSSEGPPFFLIVGLFAVMLLLGMLLAMSELLLVLLHAKAVVVTRG